MRSRSYSELSTLSTLNERFEYLALGARVGDVTFGYERHLNQAFYRSSAWKQARRHVILRDSGCDLGVEGYDIHRGLYIHHMNPMTPEDIASRNLDILNPEYLITTSHQTHNAIHYGAETHLPRGLVVRKPGDTKLW